MAFGTNYYESRDSTGKASLRNMLNHTQQTLNAGNIEIQQLAKLLIRGGWPANINVSDNKILIYSLLILKINFAIQVHSKCDVLESLAHEYLHRRTFVKF